MDQAICSLISKPFYSGILETIAEPQSSSLLPPVPGEPAVLISFLPEDGSAVEQTLDGSRVNKKSAEFITKLVCQYLNDDPTAIVGVIAPYRGQVTYIRRLVREIPLRLEQTKRLRLGTVHAFQGSEADVIVWDLVDTRNHKIGRLYHQDAGERLTNVAISRAKGKLVIVGDPDAFFLAPGKESVGKLRNILAIHFHSNSPRVVAARDVMQF
jgi:superfamily I DNA and/or RNA helicase